MKELNKDDFEFEDFATEIIDLLAVALHFAGVKKDKINEAIDIYLKELNNVDENLDYGQNEMIKVIEGMKDKYPKLF